MLEEVAGRLVGPQLGILKRPPQRTQACATNRLAINATRRELVTRHAQLTGSKRDFRPRLTQQHPSLTSRRLGRGEILLGRRVILSGHSLSFHSGLA